MNTFIQWLLIGFGGGFVLLLIGIPLFNLIRNTIERRRIKKMINNKQFLITIDERDYDSKAWEKEIDKEKCKIDLENLNKTIFKK